MSLSRRSSVFRFKTNYIPYFLYLKVLNPATQIDLSAGSDQSWNILSYKILHGVQKIHVPMRLQMWYASEWMRMLSVWHDKSFLLYFLGNLSFSILVKEEKPGSTQIRGR